MEHRGDHFIQRAVSMSAELNRLADDADGSAPDDGCAVLNGIIRDCAHKIRQRAEHERRMHRMHHVT